LPIETKKLDSHGGLCLKKKSFKIVQVELNRHERRVDKKKKLLRSKDILIIPNFYAPDSIYRETVRGDVFNHCTRRVSLGRREMNGPFFFALACLILQRPSPLLLKEGRERL
jgi:hypothetical protein